MGMISQKTIDEIKNAADILDVVGEFVALQPAGKNHKGLCPFHNEKTPSFFVSKERNWFHCFGCGEKGDSITFIMKYKNMNYVESLNYLADKYHIKIETDETDLLKPNVDRYYRINEEAMQFFGLHLTNLEKGKNALDYLKKRGLDIHTIQYFEIGYAPKETDQLYSYLKTKYEEIDMLSIGLIKKSDQGYYDLFRDRVIFPVKNELGKVVGFSGRIYQDQPNEPKYVNSPYTDIFTKGEILYNLDKAQPFIRKQKRIVLYEGFMDVIASVKAGVKEAVCSMGTQLTLKQARLIKKYTDHAIICYDGDNPGIEAAAKAAAVLEEAGVEIAIVILPEGLDPDEYTKKYSDKAFQEYLEKAKMDVYDFRYQHLIKEYDLKKPAQVERLKTMIFDYLIATNSGTLTDLFLTRLAKDCAVTYEALREDFNNYLMTIAIRHNLKERQKVKSSIAIIDGYAAAEDILINYYLGSDEYRNKIHNQLPGGFWEDSLNMQIASEIKAIASEGIANLSRETVIQKFSASSRDKVANKLFAYEYAFNDLEFSHCIIKIKIRELENEIKRIEEEITAKAGDDNSLNKRKIELRKASSSLKEELKGKPNGQKRHH